MGSADSGPGRHTRRLPVRSAPICVKVIPGIYRCPIEYEMAMRQSASIKPRANGGLLRREKNMAWLARDTGKPGAQVRIGGKVEPALVRDMRIGIERDVGDGVALGHEKTQLRQMRIHDGKGRASLLKPRRQFRAAR